MTHLLYHCHSDWHQSVHRHWVTSHWQSLNDSVHLTCTQHVPTNIYRMAGNKDEKKFDKNFLATQYHNTNILKIFMTEQKFKNSRVRSQD